jgi:hypothetical protein
MPVSQQVSIAPSQQLSHALTAVLVAQRRFSRLTPAQQSRVLRQLAQLSGAIHSALHTATISRPG